MKKLKSFLIAALWVVLSPTYAQDDFKEIEGFLLKLTKSSEYQEMILNQIGATGQSRPIMKEHIKEIFANDRVIITLVKEMQKSGLLNPSVKNPRALSQQFAYEWVTSTALAGMNRLSAEDQRSLILFVINLMSTASPQECRTMILNGSNSKAAKDMERKAITKTQPNVLRAYLQVLRKAILAEINDYPMKREMSSAQIELADIKLGNDLKASLEKMPNGERLQKALLDPALASPEDICTAGILTLLTIYDAKGFAGDLVVNKYISSIN